MSRKPEAAVRVAIAEDNEDARVALRTMLTIMGHVVVCEAADGSELIARCHKDQVDLVISDLDMPGVDGLEAAETLAKRGIPVLLLSGHPDVDYVNVEHEPVVGRLRKPATAATLEAAIKRVMAGKPR